MNTLKRNLLALALGLAFSAGAMADAAAKASANGISQEGYMACKARIVAESRLNRSDCDTFALNGNARDICIAEANGNEKIALAYLEDSYRLNRESLYQVRIAQPEADYAVAKEKCDDLAGNAKDVCVLEAQAMRTTGIADANEQMRISAANALANEQIASARAEALRLTSDANKEAAADKLQAQFKLATEKCDDLAGNAKDLCRKDAKAHFGKL